jgi:hypothetical protein
MKLFKDGTPQKKSFHFLMSRNSHFVVYSYENFFYSIQFFAGAETHILLWYSMKKEEEGYSLFFVSNFFKASVF